VSTEVKTFFSDCATIFAMVATKVQHRNQTLGSCLLVSGKLFTQSFFFTHFRAARFSCGEGSQVQQP